MKLSTLLLSSAALVVAGSAYAADLPAKKGAPAAKAATGCPAFGAGYFQIPGGDTCLKFGGLVRYTGTMDNTASPKYAQASYVEFAATAKSNTEMGALTSYLRVAGAATGSSGLNRAYLQLGGLTAGRPDSVMDIPGTNQTSAWSNGWGAGTNNALQYAIPVGAGTMTVAVEDALASNASGTASRPDVAAVLTVPAGGLNFTLGVVSHEANYSTTYTKQGYAAIGRVGANLGGTSVVAWAGTSTAATAYTSGASSTNYDVDSSGNGATGWNYGGEVGVPAGPGTFFLGMGQYNYNLAAVSNTTTTSIGAAYQYNVTKGLYATPAFLTTDNGTTKTNQLLIRINRDF